MDTTTPDFIPFQKIPRLSRDMVVTEKIDGTNGVIYVGEDGRVLAGSRNRWLNRSLGIDNFTFALWVEQWNATLAEVLGPGIHHGEWWGHGIQRGYGLDHKRFSLFNPRYTEAVNAVREAKGIELHMVPVLFTGPFDQRDIEIELSILSTSGSLAAPGFMQPEGVVIYHTASKQLFKKTIIGDEKPKGSSE